MLKSNRERLCDIYWSVWRKSSWKKSLLVICKILGLFVTKLTAHDKYSVLYRGNLLQHFQMQLSQKRKTFSTFFFFFCIFAIQIQFWTFSKKRWPSELMCSWTSGLRKTWLDKCLKSPVSEDPLRSNMINAPGHSWNLIESTFTIFSNHCEDNSVGKSLC